MIIAIKPVYNRKTNQYRVEVETGDQHVILGLIHAGYYVTDNLAATLGRVTAGKCEWYEGLNVRQQHAVHEWLLNNVK